MMILNRIKLAVDRTIAAFSVAVMIALVVCVVWQVFSRYVLNQPSTLTDELAERYGDCDVEMQMGGQPLYYYLVSVE